MSFMFYAECLTYTVQSVKIRIEKTKRRERTMQGDITVWVQLSDAAKEIEISRTKLSRLVREKRVKSKRDPRDERVVLVDMQELRVMFPPR